MEEKEIQTVSKIEVDEKTAEPSIVEVPVEQAVIESATADGQDISPKKAKRDEQAKREDREDAKSIGKQMVMKQVLGLPTKTDNISKRQKTFKIICVTVFIVFVVGVLAWTAYNDFFSPNAEPVVWADIATVLGENWYYFLFAILAMLGVLFFKGLKLAVLCKHLTGKFHFKTCFETGIVGQYYNYVTPLSAGGQPFEIYHLSKHGVHGGVAASLPTAAFFMNQLGFTLLAIVALIGFIPGINFLSIPDTIVGSTTGTVLIPMAAVGIVLGFIVPFLVILFCFLPKIGSRMVHLAMGAGAKLKIVKNKELTTFKTLKTVVHNSKCLKNLAKSPLIVALSLILSFCEQLSLCSIAYFTLRSFGFDFPAWSVWEWGQVVLVCLVLYSAITFIPTPGNSGAADLSFYWLFSTGLAVGGVAFPAMLIWRILSYYGFILIGFTFTTLKRRSDRHKERLGIPLYKEPRF